MTGGARPQRIAIRCDASGTIGGGHAMRCLTLANALAAQGAKIVFVAAAMPEALEERILGAGHQIERIPASPELQREGYQWEEPPLSADVQLADAKATGAAVGRSDWIIVDHYLLDACWHSAARAFADQVLAIDDLANRSYNCDILLDQTFGRSVEDYRKLVPADARIFAGTTYALLRPEFARERPAALDRRQADGAVRRILISMGTADAGGITGRILDGVLAVAPECATDVVLGPQATSLERVHELATLNSGISIHVNSVRMAELMRDADIAIGAAGTTSWERCCLGLPTITVVLADNQRFVAANLERAGAVVLADSPDAIAELLRTLANHEQMRFSMVAAAAAIVDGQGATRIAEAMTGLSSATESEPTVRLARPEDSRMVWLWRNDFMTRKFSQAAAPIPWPDHKAWWQRTRESADRELMIAEVAGVPVAAVRFDQVAERGVEVSINLAPSARNSGLGGRVLAKACATFLDRHGPIGLFATIHRDNPASRRIFERLGFVRADNLSNSAFERYVLAEGNAQ